MFLFLLTDSPENLQKRQEEYEKYEQYESFEDEQEAIREEEIANQLAAEQEYEAAVNEASQIAERGRRFGRPSIVKYSTLFLIAIVADFVDLSQIAGVTIPFAFVISVICLMLLTLISWLTNTNVKQAEKFIQDIPSRIAEIELRVARASRLMLRVAKTGRKNRLTRAAANRIIKSMGRIRRLARGNPVLRILISSGLDIIPLLDILPFNLIGVYLAYRAEKKILLQAREAGNTVLRETLNDSNDS